MGSLEIKKQSIELQTRNDYVYLLNKILHA